MISLLLPSWPKTLAICLAFFFCLVAKPARAAEPPGVAIGSKSFTESVILGEILSQLARQTGAVVSHRAELGGTRILWEAIKKGDIDAYVDYTGTIRDELLAGELPASSPVANNKSNDFQQLRAGLQKHQIHLSMPLGFNNTYALGMRETLAAKLNIKTISDLQKQPGLALGLSDEFVERKDGWRQLASHYRLPQKNMRTMNHTLAYQGLVNDSIQITDLYTTDAEIPFYQLRVLEDDLAFFPSYQAVLLIRADLFQRAPLAAEALLRLEGKLTSTAIAALSARVKLEKISETVVAAQWLRQNLEPTLLVPDDDQSARQRRLLQRLGQATVEHLFLVVVSLLAAILVAVPLGIYAARHDRMGQIVLAMVGIVQTLPSLALLVFMIPFFGLGPTSAIVALFCYSLLPIVRNTYSGLRQIPPTTCESAEVLGLSAWDKLRLVEFPLALPLVLSGIKTAAVINVGTATIGALVGAGGYGSVILTGIRLLDIPLILQGAIPAALMALLAQYLFGWIEKLLVSPGLRLNR